LFRGQAQGETEKPLRTKQDWSQGEQPTKWPQRTFHEFNSKDEAKPDPEGGSQIDRQRDSHQGQEDVQRRDIEKQDVSFSKGGKGRGRRWKGKGRGWGKGAQKGKKPGWIPFKPRSALA